MLPVLPTERIAYLSYGRRPLRCRISILRFGVENSRCDGVSGFQLGDRVADMTVLGSNAAYRTLRADHLTRVPAGVDAAEAATLILSWTTAYQLLHRSARVQRGQRVLVQGAAGAVGQALLALGRMAGLEL